MNFLPQNALEIVVLFIGVFIGIAFVFSGWKGSTKDSDFKNDPRVKNITWAVSGFFVTLLTDWKSLLGQSNIDKTRLLAMYGIPLITVAVLGVLAIAGVIFVRFALLRRTHPEDYPDEPFSPALAYLFYGYKYHTEEYERLLEKKRENQLPKLQERFKEFRGNAGYASDFLAGITLAVGQYLKGPAPELRRELTERILQYMCDVVLSITGRSVLNASLMIAVPSSKTSNRDWESARYVWGDRTRYGHLLVIVGYARPIGQEHFALTVEDPQKTLDWIDWTLLGAPEAFLRQRPLVVQTTKLDFAKKIPQNVRGQIEKYFEGKQFKSFACLVVPGSEGALGIVNIESEEEHIFQESDEVQNDIAKILNPSCALLSLVCG